MNTNFRPDAIDNIQTECGKQFDRNFKAMKLVRDEKHNFHIVYKTFSNEYIYSFCNPFQDTSSEHAYRLISEEEAKAIFLGRLSQENAHELFQVVQSPVMHILP